MSKAIGRDRRSIDGLCCGGCCGDVPDAIEVHEMVGMTRAGDDGDACDVGCRIWLDAFALSCGAGTDVALSLSDGNEFDGSMTSRETRLNVFWSSMKIFDRRFIVGTSYPHSIAYGRRENMTETAQRERLGPGGRARAADGLDTHSEVLLNWYFRLNTFSVFEDKRNRDARERSDREIKTQDLLLNSAFTQVYSDSK